VLEILRPIVKAQSKTPLPEMLGIRIVAAPGRVILSATDGDFYGSVEIKEGVKVEQEGVTVVALGASFDKLVIDRHRAKVKPSPATKAETPAGEDEGEDEGEGDDPLPKAPTPRMMNLPGMQTFTTVYKQGEITLSLDKDKKGITFAVGKNKHSVKALDPKKFPVDPDETKVAKGYFAFLPADAQRVLPALAASCLHKNSAYALMGSRWHYTKGKKSLRMLALNDDMALDVTCKVKLSGDARTPQTRHSCVVHHRMLTLATGIAERMPDPDPEKKKEPEYLLMGFGYDGDEHPDKAVANGVWCVWDSWRYSVRIFGRIPDGPFPEATTLLPTGKPRASMDFERPEILASLISRAAIPLDGDVAGEDGTLAAIKGIKAVELELAWAVTSLMAGFKNLVQDPENFVPTPTPNLSVWSDSPLGRAWLDAVPASAEGEATWVSLPAKAAVKALAAMDPDSPVTVGLYPDQGKVLFSGPRGKAMVKTAESGRAPATEACAHLAHPVIGEEAEEVLAEETA
jgi:hypothetical protein